MTTGGGIPGELIAEREHDPGVSSLLTSLLEYLNYLQGLGVLSEDAVRSIYAKVAFRVFPKPTRGKPFDELTLEEQRVMTDDEFENYPEEGGWYLPQSIGIEDLKRQTYVSEALTWRKTQAKAQVTTEGKTQLKQEEQGIKLLNAQLNYFVETGQMTPEYALNLFSKSAEGFPESDVWQGAIQARYIQTLEVQAEQIKKQQVEQQRVEQQRGIYEQLAKEQRDRARIAYQNEPQFRGEEPGQPPLPAPETEQFQEMLGKMSPNMRRYFERSLGGIFGEFKQEFPGAREAWWNALQPAPVSEEGLPAGAAALGTQFGISPEQAAQTALRYATGADVGEFTGLTTGQRGQLATLGLDLGAFPGEAGTPSKPRDPWETYLEKYPFAQTFLETPRRQRGFYPSRTAPQARWFT